MSWDKYYHQDVTIPNLLSNLYGQKEFLAEIIKGGPRKILEVGTGTGTMSIFLSWLGFNITSIDINQEVINQAQKTAQQLNAQVHFQVADTFKLDFPDRSFDVVFHQGLLEHFTNEDICKILDEQLRVSKRVVLSVPNRLYPRRDFGDERLLTKQQWEKILDKYKIVHSMNYSPKILPKPYIPKANIQYMAVIEKA